jgi:hypothetical protein
LAIEAYVLSKLDCGDMLEELDLSYMRGPALVEQGEQVVDEGGNT